MAGKRRGPTRCCSFGRLHRPRAGACCGRRPPVLVRIARHRSRYGWAVRVEKPARAVLPARRGVLMKAVGRRPRRRFLPDLKAEALAWWVSASSDRRLQSVMRSHLRRAVVADLPHDRPARTAREGRQRGRGVQDHRPARRRRLTTATGSRSPTASRTSRYDGPPALTLELGPVAFLRLVSGTASPAGLLLTREAQASRWAASCSRPAHDAQDPRTPSPKAVGHALSLVSTAPPSTPAMAQASTRRSEIALSQRWHEQAGADAALKVAGPPRRTA